MNVLLCGVGVGGRTGGHGFDVGHVCDVDHNRSFEPDVGYDFSRQRFMNACLGRGFAAKMSVEKKSHDQALIVFGGMRCGRGLEVSA